MKFLLAGGYDTQNLGDYASFLALYKLIKQRLPSSTFSVLSRHTNDQFGDEFDVETIMNMDHSSKRAAQGRIFNGFNELDQSEHLQAMLAELSGSDCLIFGNGRLFVDISLGFMSGPLNYFALLTILARFLGKPIVLSSVTLVHPTSDEGKELLGFILKNADLLLVREHSSAEVARHYIENTDKLFVVPDVAFAVTKADATTEGLPEIPKGAIGVNFRGINYADSSGDAQFHRLAKKVMRLIDSENAPIVFCHQCTYDVDSSITDDRHANQMVYDSLPESYQKRCLISWNKWSLAQTLGIYSKLEHLYTERRHGFILSLSQGTPASLICNEKNTAVVSESVPLKGAFLGPEDHLDRAHYSHGMIEEILTNLRLQLDEYPSRIDRIISEK